MAYFEMILTVAAALTGLVVLALLASSVTVPHRHPGHFRSGAFPRHSAAPVPATAVATSPALSRHHGASRRTRLPVDRSKTKDAHDRRASTLEAAG